MALTGSFSQSATARTNAYLNQKENEKTEKDTYGNKALYGKDRDALSFAQITKTQKHNLSEKAYKLLEKFLQGTIPQDKWLEMIKKDLPLYNEYANAMKEIKNEADAGLPMTRTQDKMYLSNHQNMVSAVKVIQAGRGAAGT